LINPVAEPIELIGVTAGQIEFDKSRTEPLMIAPVFPPRQEIMVRFRSARDFDTYRLDGRISAGSSIAWSPAPVFAKTPFVSSDLAMLGNITTPDGTKFVPLSLAPVKDVSRLVIMIKPRVDLRKLSWQWTPFIGGACQASPSEPSAIPRTATLNRAPLTFSVPIKERPIACLEITGFDRNGQPTGSPPFVILTGSVQ
jgi:hypothetical protein